VTTSCTEPVEARGVHFAYGDRVSSASQIGTGSKIRGVYDRQAALGRVRPRRQRWRHSLVRQRPARDDGPWKAYVAADELPAVAVTVATRAPRAWART
jgi:hypothetical protein